MATKAQGCRARPFTHSTRPVLPCGSSRSLCTLRVSASAAGAGAGDGVHKKHRVIFLGTPEVAAGVLRELLAASQRPDSQFEVCLVVSQPGKPRGRGHRPDAPLPSPVEAVARDSGLLGPAGVVCPERAKEESFLRLIEELQPDLAITAAYGNMLPQRFLAVPKYGTLNIHPSLLPKYRGAAPVQRALQDGVTETGVSVAYTVLSCDAGPVLAQQRVPVDPDIQAPELLSQLFSAGSQLLLGCLPDVWAGRGPQRAVPQDEAQALHAAKLGREEALLDFRSAPAPELHNRVRAFAGWPGTSARFLLRHEGSGATEPLELKIVRTRAPPPSPSPSPSTPLPASPSSSSPSLIASSASHPTDSSSHTSTPTQHQHPHHSQQQPQLQAQQPHAAQQQPESPQPQPQPQGCVEVCFSADAMLVPCAGGTVLEVLQVQPPTKKVMSVKDFRNGLRGKRLLLPTSASTFNL